MYSHANTIRGYDTSTNMLFFEDPYDGLYHAQNFNDYSSGVHWDGYAYEWDGSIFDIGIK